VVPFVWPGVITRPVSCVAWLLQGGTASHRGHSSSSSPRTLAQVVGVVMPPTQVWVGLQSPQSNWLPQLSTNVPQSQPRLVQLAPFGTHVGAAGSGSH
jgi:hypothetical protein